MARTEKTTKWERLALPKMALGHLLDERKSAWNNHALMRKYLSLLASSLGDVLERTRGEAVQGGAGVRPFLEADASQFNAVVAVAHMNTKLYPASDLGTCLC